MFSFLLVILITIILFARHLVVIIATLIGIASAGFLSGLGVGLLMHLFIKWLDWASQDLITKHKESIKNDQH